MLVLSTQLIGAVHAEDNSREALVAQFDTSARTARSHVEEQLARVSSSLVRRHLTSVLSLIELEGLQIGLGASTMDTDRLSQSVTYLNGIVSGLAPTQFSEGDYVETGRRSLVMAFLATTDKSIQYYILSLPKRFDPGKQYPLVVTLHGAGNDHLLFYPHLQFLPVDSTPVAENTTPLEDYIGVFPWGRGNAGYVQYAEKDIWQSIAEAAKYVHFDPDRRYIVGYSMGARGAWNVAARRPDFWAAVALASLPLGTKSAEIPDVRYAQNLMHVPVRIWTGMRDRPFFHESARKLATSLAAYGANPTLIMSESDGHRAPESERRSAIHWLLQHRRQKPTEFTFLSDRNEYRGIWGIELSFEPEARLEQTLMCNLESDTAWIVTHGVSKILIDPSPTGLGLGERGKIIWNGKEEHNGAFPSEPISLESR